MKAEIKVDISGITHISEKNMKKGVQDGLRNTLIFMHGIGVKVTPIRTGFLRKGFRERLLHGKASFFNDVKYAGFVNDGTKFQKANPFMENIIKETEPQIEKLFLQNFKILGIG